MLTVLTAGSVAAGAEAVFLYLAGQGFAAGCAAAFLGAGVLGGLVLLLPVDRLETHSKPATRDYGATRQMDRAG